MAIRQRPSSVDRFDAARESCRPNPHAQGALLLDGDTRLGSVYLQGNFTNQHDEALEEIVVLGLRPADGGGVHGVEGRFQQQMKAAQTQKDLHGASHPAKVQRRQREPAGLGLGGWVRVRQRKTLPQAKETNRIVGTPAA